MEEKLVEIKGIVAEVSEMEPEEIDNDGLLKDDYGIDSMRMIEILATLEKIMESKLIKKIFRR